MAHSSITFQSILFSPEHWTRPFAFSDATFDAQTQQLGELSTSKKVHIIALTVLIGLITLGVGALPAFYGLAAYYKKSKSDKIHSPAYSYPYRQGIVNTGNSCWLNTALKMIATCNEAFRPLLDNCHDLSKIVDKLQQKDKGVVPRKLATEFKTIMSFLCPKINVYRQNEPSELIYHLLKSFDWQQNIQYESVSLETLLVPPSERGEVNVNAAARQKGEIFILHVDRNVKVAEKSWRKSSAPLPIHVEELCAPEDCGYHLHIDVEGDRPETTKTLIYRIEGAARHFGGESGGHWVYDHCPEGDLVMRHDDAKHPYQLVRARAEKELSQAALFMLRYIGSSEVVNTEEGNDRKPRSEHDSDLVQK
jgi:hypothetical protein